MDTTPWPNARPRGLPQVNMRVYAFCCCVSGCRCPCDTKLSWLAALRLSHRNAVNSCGAIQVQEANCCQTWDKGLEHTTRSCTLAQAHHAQMHTGPVSWENSHVVRRSKSFVA